MVVMMAHASKGKMVTFPQSLNLSTAKESMHHTGFSDVAWSRVTHGYATSAHSLMTIKFDAIIQGAWEFMKPIHAHNRTTEAVEILDIDDDDELACLVDNSDLDGECTSPCLLYVYYSLANINLYTPDPATKIPHPVFFDSHSSCILTYHTIRFNSGPLCFFLFSMVPYNA